MSKCLTPGCVFKIESGGRKFSIQVTLPFHPGWGSWDANQARAQEQWLHDVVEKAIAERYQSWFQNELETKVSEGNR